MTVLMTEQLMDLTKMLLRTAVKIKMKKLLLALEDDIYHNIPYSTHFYLQLLISYL